MVLQTLLSYMRVTQKIKEASDLIGINFCDHIIVGREGYFSFNEAKLFNKELMPIYTL